ncbi:hypothetical protein MPSEU_000136600 [Mayamaea pseudoterrestris]|nr:hypothetical protein MPSEU_000136600 [Mayamaea pseudoterrestris]
MPVWFPAIDQLETFITEPARLQQSGYIDDDSFDTAEGSLERLEEDNYFESNEDFGNTSMAFDGDDLMLDDNDMFYFDSMRDMNDFENNNDANVSSNAAAHLGTTAAMKAAQWGLGGAAAGILGMWDVLMDSGGSLNIDDGDL